MATKIPNCLHSYYMFSHNTSMTPTSKKCPEHNGCRPGKQLARRVVFVAYFGRIWDLLSWFLLAIGIESKSSSIKKLESTIDGISPTRSWLNIKRSNQLEYMPWLKNRMRTYISEKKSSDWYILATATIRPSAWRRDAMRMNACAWPNITSHAQNDFILLSYSIPQKHLHLT